MAAPAFGAVGSALTDASSTSANVPVPAGVAANDIIVVVMTAGTSTTVVTPPAGFTQAGSSPAVGNNPGQLVYGRVFWKRATGADAGTYDFSFAVAEWRVAYAARFTGCVTSGDPFDATNAPAAGDYDFDGSPGPIPGATVTTTDADRLLVYASFNWGAGGTHTPPSGFTARGAYSSGPSVAFSTKEQAAAGSSGAVSGSWSAGGRIQHWMGALKPVAAAPANTSGFFSLL